MHLSDRSFDAIVIGGGHNGLIAAAYLAKAGKRVLLLEASDGLGGALATGEISPDYRVSSGAHLLDALPRRIEKDLKLAKHGLRYAMRRLPTIVLDRDNQHLVLSTRRADLEIMRRHSAADTQAYVAYVARMKAHAALLTPLLKQSLPSAGTRELRSLLRKLVWRAECLGPTSLEVLMRQVPGSIGDFLDNTFETPLLKGALALDALLGESAGPYEAGTVLSALHRRSLRSGSSGLHVVEGGLGAFIDALAAAAAGFGVVIKTSTPVKRILVSNGEASGIETASGDIFQAPLVLSSVHPRTTMLDMVGVQYIDAGLAKRLSQIANRGATAKLNLALDGLPTIQGLAPVEYGARLLVASSLSSLEESFTRFKQGDFSSELAMEVTIPSVMDAPLAPHGQHVMSIVVQYVPFEAAGGWEENRDRLIDRIIETLSVHAPDLRQRIVAGELMLPPDIERKFGLAGGNWHHGDLRMDQLLMFRPAPELAGHRTPVKGLYLCGAGSHPAGGMSGLPGQLAAQAAMEDGRRA
ncbi:MAG: NAD(P)/FAD-dependent oxidoreductase [Parvibaculum sp.]|uniref:phytoene desaturase family protein n=1 Tax=Parvibaculum sp. TaxID=2024848 RepID=UPI003C719B0F